MDKRVALLMLFVCGIQSASCCCFPKQFEGIEGLSIGAVINGTGTSITGLLKFSFDLDQQKSYSSGTTYVMGKPFQVQVLQDFANNTLYTVTNGNCSVQPFFSDMLECIPDTAYKTLSSYYGVGDDSFDIDMYYFTYGGSEISTTVTKNGCVLLSKHVEMDNMLISSGFMGITLGIKDRSVFNIPSACQQIRYTTRDYFKTRDVAILKSTINGLFKG